MKAQAHAAQAPPVTSIGAFDGKARCMEKKDEFSRFVLGSTKGVGVI